MSVPASMYIPVLFHKDIQISWTTKLISSS